MADPSRGATPAGKATERSSRLPPKKKTCISRARPSKAPKRPLELFSFESSPYSRRVRELLSELELPYLLRNTGKARWQDLGPPILRKTLFPELPVVGRTRSELLERAGKVQVPYLVDPNTDTALFESQAIRTYLLDTYAR